MFIQTEETPNPSTLKFIPGIEVLANGTAQINEISEADDYPLAKTLMNIKDVESVFLARDFLSVTKSEDSQWSLIKPEILTNIMDFFINGNNMSSTTEFVEEYDKKDQEVVNQIKEIIENRVRPAVAQDGGDIIFKGFSEGIVKLELHGACSGCPSSTITLKDGIENMLKHYVPEVERVEAYNE